MAYENTQIAPDGKRRNIKSESSDVQDTPDVVEDVKDLAEESQDKDASNQSDESINDEPEKNATSKDDEFPKHVGRGVWQLRSGEKVKGKTEAVEAQAKEDESNDDSGAS